jgi:hypothetical protein
MNVLGSALEIIKVITKYKGCEDENESRRQERFSFKASWEALSWSSMSPVLDTLCKVNVTERPDMVFL